MIDGPLTQFGGAALAAVILSLAFEWLPAFRKRWDLLTSGQKQSAMALAVFALTLIAAAVDCWLGDVCPTDWYAFASQALLVFLSALGIQQGVYRVIRRPR